MHEKDTTTLPPKRETKGRVAVRLPGEATPAPKPKRAKKGRRGDDVRERVLRAALECFGAFGFEGTSTRAVAERADVTHTLVLYHFRSKDLLWRATIQNIIGNYTTTVSQATAEENVDAATELRRFIERFVRFSAENPQVHRILTMESNQGTDRLQWAIDNFLREHFTRVRDLIRRGQLEGSVREGDPARLYYHIIGAGGTPFTLSTEYMELTGRDIFSEKEVLRTIAFIFEIVFV